MVPRYAENHGTLIRLGSILSDPENLESSLNLDAIPPIPESTRRDATTHVRQYVRSEMRNSNSALVKAMPSMLLLSAGLRGEAGRVDKAETTVQAVDVRAEVFMPDKAFMQAALQHSAVIEHARANLFGTSLYVIVGVATAGELFIREGRGRRAGVSAGLVAPAPVGIEHERVGELESEVAVKNACDFAYRLREFVYTRIRGGLRDKGDYGENSMFGHTSAVGKPAAAAQKPVEDLPKFLYLEKEDVATPSMAYFAVSED